VGNLVENKGHHLAIEALPSLPDFRLAIAGEGPERPALMALANQIKVAARVEFLGRVDQDKLATCYGAADILVLPSSREGWPNVLLESMACGTPVVATKVGGIPEIVTSPDVGRLMSQRNATDLAKAVAELWQNRPDRASVSAYAKGFSWQNTTEAQIALFDRMATTGWDSVHA
jgi:glycosyltransferase involved in cell wall biosynthesis